MTDQQPEFNPYQAPARDTAVIDPPLELWRAFVVRYRSEAHALAFGYLFIGFVSCLLAIIEITGRASEERPINNGSLGTLAVELIVSCVSVCLVACLVKKSPRALRTNVRASYFLGALLILPLFFLAGFAALLGLIILGLAISQGHRVLQWGQLLQQAGIPTTIRPHEITAEHVARLPQTPPG